jgi:outer membrane biogenesis lipoprotein LolB
MRRTLARRVLLAAFALALLSLHGCASDGTNPDREPRHDERNPWQQPGFTPFSA